MQAREPYEDMSGVWDGMDVNVTDDSRCLSSVWMGRLGIDDFAIFRHFIVI